MSQSWRRLWGSSPVVGSSRNKMRGLPTRAVATGRRCFWPPESLPTQASAFSVSSNSWSPSSGGGGSVWAEESEALAGFDAQADSADGFDFSVVGLAQVGALDGRSHEQIVA